MKAITLNVSGGALTQAKRILDEFSGVLAVDAQGSRVIAHCGDRLDAQTLIDRLSQSGYSASFVTEKPEI